MSKSAHAVGARPMACKMRIDRKKRKESDALRPQRRSVCGSRRCMGAVVHSGCMAILISPPSMEGLAGALAFDAISALEVTTHEHWRVLRILDGNIGVSCPYNVSDFCKVAQNGSE